MGFLFIIGIYAPGQRFTFRTMSYIANAVRLLVLVAPLYED